MPPLAVARSATAEREGAACTSVFSVSERCLLQRGVWQPAARLVWTCGGEAGYWARAVCLSWSGAAAWCCSRRSSMSTQKIRFATSS